MEIKQIYDFVNTATQEALGTSALVKEDLSNIVDIGTALADNQAYDKYVGALVNRIGKTIFVNRAYQGGAPSVLMDGWEYGSVMQKVQAELPSASENESWELQDQTSYDPNIFYKPQVSVKFYNKKTTFEIDLSIAEKQVKQSLISIAELNAFISMIYNAVDRSLTIKVDELIMRTIDNMIAETVHAEYGTSALSSKSTTKAVNLLYEYKQIHATSTLTSSNCLYDKDFVKFCAYKIGLVSDRLTKISSLYNVGAKARFTPKDMQHVVLLSEFANQSKVWLSSDTFHNDLVALPNYESVAYWQGSGTDYAFGNTGKVYCTTTSGHDVTATGIIGVVFDRDSLGVMNPDRRVTTNYNPKAEFYNNFYKFDCSYFNDLNENFVVFFVA